MTCRFRLLALVLAATAFNPIAIAEVRAATVKRLDNALEVTWKSANPVDVYVSDRPDAPVASAKPVERANISGRFILPAADTSRRYFTLVDQRDHKRIEVAERLLPLVQGSNFRDIGGYEGAGGKHVRWGLIYRSGGQPTLSVSDIEQIKKLGLMQLVDLRSSEERVIAPTKIYGVPYMAIGYSMADIMGSAPSNQPQSSQMQNGMGIYHNLPHLLAPHLKIIFADLLAGRTPIAYNCSAGQDRTGFTTAMILAALGVSRETIIEDYHLSTQYRRPEWEMPALNSTTSSDSATQMFSRARQDPNWKTPQPLNDAEGRPFLLGAFEEIESKWGSLDVYLDKEAGLQKADIAKLQQKYLE